MPHRFLLGSLTLFLVTSAFAQDPTLQAPENGPRQIDVGHHLLLGGTLHVAPGTTIEDGALSMRDGRIEWVGNAAEAERTSGARLWNCEGMHLYPGLIDAHVKIEAPKEEEDENEDRRHWNPLVRPERDALDGELKDKLRTVLRESGFSAGALAFDNGIFRGSSPLVSLGEPEKNRPSAVYVDEVYQSVAFDRIRRGRGDGISYPGSLMGSMAVARQVLSDVGTLQLNVGIDERAKSSNPLMRLCSDQTPFLLFHTSNELDALRAARLADELGRRAVLLGSGMEFRRLDALAATQLPVVLPLTFPEAPSGNTLGAIDAINLRSLMNWEQAPTNARRMDAAGVPLVLTTSELDDVEDFHKNLRKAIENGLDPNHALEMLTVGPAQLLGVTEQLGTLDPGKIANVLVTNGELFDEETIFHEFWIDGRLHELNARPEFEIEGRWRVTLNPAIEDEILFDVSEKGKLLVRSGDAKRKAGKVIRRGPLVDFTFEHQPFGEAGYVTISGLLESSGQLRGSGLRGDGTRFTFVAEHLGEIPEEPSDEESDEDGAESADDSSKETDEESGDEKEAEKEEEKESDIPEDLGLPFGAYMRTAAPEQETVLIIGATIWTSGPDGTIEDGALLLSNGKVEYVGPATGAPELAPGSRQLDATGLHITPGLIDCHSHTGIQGGVNESGQAVTAEVRIGDVTNPDAMNWYRQLAGGVTTVNNLHGSANPMGGQNQVNKIRWGVAHPDEMHFAGAPTGIKFALGENVKQSNWGEENKTRYPQTRMGVETLMRDRFTAAREYAAGWDAYNERMSQGGPPPDPPQPRRDLELEALAEILAGERLIHCHSYRQDEIMMLCRIAGDFGFKIGTFQHVLEGYKVADEIAQHALGGSCFSDWWAYKVEVQDAIPEAGAIMHEQGVCVSFNSDSDELARRMNVEAAKAMKYGGLSPEEALKFVTLNPAIQLGIDEQVGSLEVGKDADVSIWSGNPLSSFSRCVSTWVDGAEQFSSEMDAEMRAWNASERQRLLHKLLDNADIPNEPVKVAAVEGEDEERRTSYRVSTRTLEGLRAWNATEVNHIHRGTCADEDLGLEHAEMHSANHAGDHAGHSHGDAR